MENNLGIVANRRQEADQGRRNLSRFVVKLDWILETERCLYCLLDATGRSRLKNLSALVTFFLEHRGAANVQMYRTDNK